MRKLDLHFIVFVENCEVFVENRVVKKKRRAFLIYLLWLCIEKLHNSCSVNYSHHHHRICCACRWRLQIGIRPGINFCSTSPIKFPEENKLETKKGSTAWLQSVRPIKNQSCRLPSNPHTHTHTHTHASCAHRYTHLPPRIPHLFMFQYSCGV